MKLLVLAQTPPPIHGQSIMVQAMLDALSADSAFSLHHLNFRLSRNAADIGRWRIAKMIRTLGFALRAAAARFWPGCDTLYYVPAPPGKRGALYRDWIILAICRPFFRRLVLHWHAGGLARWLATNAHPIERAVSRRLLGGAELAIVLAENLRDDADRLAARRVVVVPNGVDDPGEPAPPTSPAPPHQLLFLGLCSEEKGLFDAANAVIAANAHAGAKPSSPDFVLVAAGPFPDASTEQRFAALAARYPGMLRHVGFADAAQKSRLFAASRSLLFPTRYPAETFSLVALESLAHDRPIVATRWRALPEIVTPDCGCLVEIGDQDGLVAALRAVCDAPPAAGVCRARFLREFTRARHIARLRAALLSIA